MSIFGQKPARINNFFTRKTIKISTTLIIHNESPQIKKKIVSKKISVKKNFNMNNTYKKKWHQENNRCI